MSEDVFIHPSAWVDGSVEIGAGTKVWHFCHLMAGARIGRGCVLGQNVFVGAGVCIGDRVKIQNNVSVYAGVTLEDEVFCGPSVVFTNVRTPRAAFPRNGPEHRLETLVRRGATLGANATVVCGVRVGRCAFVGAGAVVTSDVADFALVTGNPARHAGWRCACGQDLTFQGGEGRCGSCRRRYRLRRGAVSEAS